jgi:glucosamine--fructose-6-phosphate aminotransferase (isomerizing)
VVIAVAPRLFTSVMLLIIFSRMGVRVANDGDEETARQADAVLWVPETEYLLAPIIDVVPMQLFAYHLARLHGLDVDRPRNLAKVVTVE